MTIRGYDAWATREPPEYPCEVCGNMVDNCICPECPVCHEVGNSTCYDPVGGPTGREHGLKRTEEQIASRKKFDDAIAAENHMYHQMEHKEMHESLDRLLADFIDHTHKLPSKTTIMELLQWSHAQTLNPTEKEK